MVQKIRIVEKGMGIKMEFPLTRTSTKQNFPFPNDGEVIFETPPTLIWVPIEGEKSYTVTVNNSDGDIIFSSVTEKNYVYDDKPWKSGTYYWNVVSESGAERGKMSFTISEKAVEFIRPNAREVYDGVPELQRPRHLFTKDDVAELLREHSSEFEVLKRNVELAYQNGMPPKPRFQHGEGELPYREYFGLYREYCDRDLIACAIMYALTGDEKAGKYAKELLLDICDNNPLGPCSVVGQFGDEVGLSNSRCLPSAFDLLYEILDDKQRKYVASTIGVYARQCRENLKSRNYVENPSDSHTGRLPAYLGEAALVLKGTGVESDETLISWLGEALDVYNGIFPFYGSSDGSWAEGAFYSTSYTKWFLPFFSAVERFSGKSLFARPFYMLYPQYLLHFCNEKYELHPFGDGYWCHPNDAEWPGFFAQDPYRVYADRFGPELARKRKAAIRDIDYFRLHLLDIFLPKSKVKFNTAICGEVENAALFEHGGFAALHTDITSENDICVLMRASKFTSDSHRHSDQGSFALFCGGKALISPSGYFGRRYGTKHHFEWTRNTIAHNVLLFDDMGQKKDVSAIGKIVELDKENKSCLMELTAAYGNDKLKKYLRRITLDKGGITVTDTVEAVEPVSVTYPLHGIAPIKACGNSVSIERENCVLTVTPLSNELKLDRITDKFGIDLNEGEPQEYHVTMPQQYHAYFKTDKCLNHEITVRFDVKIKDRV